LLLLQLLHSVLGGLLCVNGGLLLQRGNLLLKPSQLVLQLLPQLFGCGSGSQLLHGCCNCGGISSSSFHSVKLP
jgi:hypothetical protein